LSIFPIAAGSSSFRRQGDEFAHGGGPDPRDKPKTIGSPRDIFVPNLDIDTLKVKARNFH
jgi:error-prone DNA polymerase